MRVKSSIVFFLLYAFVNNCYSQDLDRVFSGGKLLTVKGGINLNQIFYTAYGNESRRDPYNYFLSGNLNLNLIGFDIPLSFSYSNRNTSFQQPFNQFSLSPTYKNIKAYVGYNSITFSKYTLAGHIFFGGAVEVSDLGKWDVAAMYGRLRRGVALDTTESDNEPSFRRVAFGTKIGYKGEGSDKVNLIIFRSNDDENSIPNDPLLEIAPEENIVLSVDVFKKIYNNFSVKAEYSGSAITRNSFLDDQATTTPAFFSVVSPFITQNSSTSYYNAFNSSLSYTGSFYTLAVNYERVDPGYETHGAYFFNNDLENITGSVSLNLLDSKVNLGINAGTQKNNLDGTELNEFTRFVGSLNATYAPKPTLTFAGNYSNFQSFTNVRPAFEAINDLTPFDNLDTLNFRQVSQSANFNTNVILKQSKVQRQNLNINIAYQTSKDQQNNSDNAETSSQFLNSNVSYSVSLIPTGLSLTASINSNINESPDTRTSGISPNLSISRPFFEKKLRATLSSTYTMISVDGVSTNRVFNLRVGFAYSLKKKHRINFNMVTLSRGAVSDMQPSQTESTGTLSYSFNF